MGTRRQQTIEAAPVRRDEPLAVTFLGMVFDDAEREMRPEGTFRVGFTFEPDGAFSVIRTVFTPDPTSDDGETLIDLPAVRHEGGTARDLMDALLAARSRD